MREKKKNYHLKGAQNEEQYLELMALLEKSSPKVKIT